MAGKTSITYEQFCKIKALAEAGDTVQQANLAVCYRNGYGIPQNLPMAIRWFRVSAEQGDLESIRMLGDCYAELKDWINARYWWEKAATNNHPQALFMLGTLYYYGHGVAVDQEQTTAYLHRAWQTNNRDVQSMIKSWCNEVEFDFDELW